MKLASSMALAIALTVSSCSTFSVSQDQRKVFVMSDIFLPHYVELVGADYQTFKSLGGNYGKDMVSVYYLSSRLPNADPDSFQTISEFLGQDSRYLYYMGHPVREAAQIREIQLLTSEYWKDTENVYYTWKRIPSAIVQSFRVKSASISEDANSVFFEDALLEHVLPGQYQVLNQEYILSPNAVYYQKKKMNVLEPKSFRLIKQQDISLFFTDGKYIYYNWHRMKTADVTTFTVLRDGFSRDKNHVYWTHFIVKNADPETFEMLPGDSISIPKDKNGVLKHREMVLENDWAAMD